MRLKDKILNIFNLAKKHFLMPFCLCIFIIVSLVYFLGLKINFMGNIFTLPFEILISVCSFYLFLISTFFLKNKMELRKKILPYLSRSFLFFLAIVFCLKLTLFFYPDTNIEGIHYSLIKYISFVITLVAAFLGAEIILLTGNNLNKDTSKKTIFEQSNKIYSILLIIIFIIFIVSRITLPFLSTGSYADEYSHLNSAIELLKSGHLMASSDYSSGYYTRGYDVSVLVALAFLIFGKSLIVAKMVPAAIGIINLFVLYAISKVAISDKKYRLLLLLIYTLSPLIIFNDFYIRMYVFYEFFTLVNTYLFIKILSVNEKRKILAYTFLIVLINLINIIFSQDQGSLLVAIIPILFFIIRFFKQILLSSKLYFKKISNRYKLLFGFIALIIVSIFLHIPSKIINFLTGTFPGTTPPQLKYDNLFFNENSLLTIFLLIMTFTIIKLENKAQKYIVLVTIIMLGLHFISSPDIQLTRAILYLLPLFYISAIIGMESVQHFINRKLLFILALLITIFNPLIISFYKLPELREEVYYVDYKAVADFVANNCQNKKIYVLHPTYNQNFYQFYNIKIDYIPYIRPGYLADDENFVNIDGVFFSKIGNTPVIKNDDYLKNTNGKICVISPNRYRFAGRSIEESDFKNLNNIFTKKSFITTDVYY